MSLRIAGSLPETALHAVNMLPQRPRVKLMSPGRYYHLGRHGHARNEGRNLFASCRHCRACSAPTFFPDCNPRPKHRELFAEICRQVEEVAAEKVSTTS
jgi:hypothetical protein